MYAIYLAITVKAVYFFCSRYFSFCGIFFSCNFAPTTMGGKIYFIDQPPQICIIIAYENSVFCFDHLMDQS